MLQCRPETYGQPGQAISDYCSGDLVPHMLRNFEFRENRQVEGRTFLMGVQRITFAGVTF